jgi:hypothetical protein
MAKYRVLFNMQKSGTLIFDAQNSEEALEVYEQLLSGETYPDDMEDSYEDIDDADTMWFELTDNSGRVISN